VGKRSYEQFCGLATALDVVGERWTLLIVRDLGLGPQRYTDLLAGLPGIGTNLLADRLRALEDHGVVRRSQLPPPAATTVYELTDSGRELREAVLPLAVWGAKRMDFANDDTYRRPDWLLVSLRARFRPDQAVGVHDTYQFDVDGQPFHVQVRDGEIDVRRGAPSEHADVVFTTTMATLYAIGVGKMTTTDAVRRKRATVSGSPEALARALAILGTGERAAAPTTYTPGEPGGVGR
jgi:DNA-binding HxlR family transcriptional regulator